MAKTKYKVVENIRIIALEGDNHYDKGYEYGVYMKDTLHSSLQFLVDTFIQKGATYEQMVDKSYNFYHRYSNSYKYFLEGEADGAEMSLDDVIILNGMETIHSIIPSSDNEQDNEKTTNQDLSQCAFISIPPEKTLMKYSLMGRNYDFTPDLYAPIAANLTITIINDVDKAPSAMIGMPGQIYCPTCMNKYGMMLEFNNGGPSGGFYADYTRQSMLINTFEVLQNSNNLEELDHQMKALQSDYSLIVSSGNSTYARSYEYSSNSTLGMKTNSQLTGEALVYTNFYLNETWKNQIPEPTDDTTWEGVTRRNNLINLSESKNDFTVNDVQKMMELTLDNGGACWEMTIYQIVFDPKYNEVSIRRPYENPDWILIDLDEYYTDLVGEINLS